MQSSEVLKRTHAADGGLTLSCLSRLSLRRCLPFSWGLAARGTKALYHESPSYIFAAIGGVWILARRSLAEADTQASRRSSVYVSWGRIALTVSGLAEACGEERPMPKPRSVIDSAAAIATSHRGYPMTGAVTIIGPMGIVQMLFS